MSNSGSDAATLIWKREFREKRPLSSGDVITVLQMVDRERRGIRAVEQLDFYTWSILLQGVKRFAKNGSRGWRKRYLLVLLIGIRDFLSLELSSKFDRLQKIGWLEELANELAPSGFARRTLKMEQDPEFQKTATALLDLLLDASRVLNPGHSVQYRIAQSMRFTPANTRKTVRWFSLPGYGKVALVH